MLSYDEIERRRKRETEERAAKNRAEIRAKEVRDEKGALIGYTDMEEGGDIYYPYPKSCAECRAYVGKGGPEHQYGLTRGHSAHCTCDGCF